MLRITRVAVVLSAWLLAKGASAQSTGELADTPYEHRIAAELGFFYRSTPASEVGLLAPGILGQFTLGRWNEAFVALDLAWRGVGSFGDISAFRAMNPYLGVRGGVESHRDDIHFRLRGGAGLTLPFTNLYDDFRGLMGPLPFGATGFDGLVTQSFAASMHGGFDLWLASPLNMAVVARGDGELRHQYVTLGADVAFAALLPVEDDGARYATTMMLQVGVFVGGRPIPELVLGARAQTALSIPVERGNAEGFVSVAPFVRAEIGTGFLEARLLMNLDEPYGLSFDDSAPLSVWSAQLLGGSTF